MSVDAIRGHTKTFGRIHEMGIVCFVMCRPSLRLIAITLSSPD